MAAHKRRHSPKVFTFQFARFACAQIAQHLGFSHRRNGPPTTEGKTMCGYKNLAHGVTTVCSTQRPECHAPSGFKVNDYSGANGARDRMRDMILAFWESQGMAEWRNGGAGGGGRWYVRDNAQGGAEWLPLADATTAGRADVAEFSHVRSARNGGAWCACGLVAESGAVNLARGDRDMSAADLSPAWRACLAAWPAYYRANVARKASLARLSA